MQTSVVIVAATVLIGFIAYLGLLAFVVTRTGDTRGLRDVAHAVRAYRGVLAIVGRSTATSDDDSTESDGIDAPRTSHVDLSTDP